MVLYTRATTLIVTMIAMTTEQAYGPMGCTSLIEFVLPYLDSRRRMRRTTHAFRF